MDLESLLRERQMELADNTPQQLWRTEFDRQYTRDMLRLLVKRSTALTRRYERYTPYTSTDTADDRIHAALAKLLGGERTWDPNRVDLCGFLLGVIASDLTGELRRSTLAPVTSVHDRGRPREDDYSGECSENACDDARGSIEEGWPVPFAPDSSDEAWSLAMSQLRAAARDDGGGLALLACWEDGVIQRRDVIARLGWSASRYKRSYQRLLVLADTLDLSVREAICHALAN